MLKKNLSQSRNLTRNYSNLKVELMKVISFLETLGMLGLIFKSLLDIKISLPIPLVDI